jgi:hypothetical protein
LVLADKALNGVPVPGKGAISVLIELIKTAEVGEHDSEFGNID